MTKDLTVGKPLKVIVNYMIPVFLGLLLQQAYNLVDTMIVGRFVGANALGGVGAASSLCLLAMGMSMGFCSGFCIPIANAFGAKEETRLRKSLAHAIYLCAINVALNMLIFMGLCGQILELMNTPKDNFDYAYDYVFMYSIGLPFAVLYNLSSGVVRALGDSKTPLFFLIISSCCNILLDLLFVVVFRWGVSGAALATSISQAIAGITCVVYMIKKLPILHFRKGDMKWNTKHALYMLSNGFPLALQYCVSFVGTMAMQVAINSLGTLYVNAVAMTNKINAIMNCTFNSIGPTMANFVGQNVGAKRVDRVRSGLMCGILISAVFSALYIILAVFFTPQMASLFLDPKEPNLETLIQYIRQYLTTMGCFSILIGLIISHRFTMQGMGYANLAIISGTLELTARLLVAFVLVPLLPEALKFSGVCLGSPMAWVFASCFVVPGAYICLRRLKKKLALEQAAVPTQQ